MPSYRLTLSDRIAPGILAAAPTHYWKLTEGGGTVANDAAAAADGVIAGSPAKGMRFDGANDIITIAGVTASTTTFTIECWLTPDSTQGDALGAILAVNSGNGLFYAPGSQKLNFRHSAADHLSTTALTDGVRVHVLFRVAAGAGTFYVNGVADGTVASVPAITPDRIGALSASTSRLKGVLQHVAYYVGTALTAAQALAHEALPTVTIDRKSLSGAETAKGDDVLSFTALSDDGTYRPSVGAECQLIVDSVVVFGGEVSRVYEDGRRVTGANSRIKSRVTATNWKQLANRIVVTDTLVAGSLESMLTTIATALAELGIVIDPAQATGPSLEEIVVDNPANEVLDLLQEMTGGAWVWEIDANKVLRFVEAASNACPFDVTTANKNAQGDVSVERRREDWYANRVVVNGGEGYWQNILGEIHFGDGVATTFPMNAPMFYYENDYTATLGYMVGLSITVVRTGGTTIEHANDQLTAQWTFNRGPEYSLTQVSGAVLGGTEYILIGSHAESGYSAQFPMTLVADDTAAKDADGLRTIVIDRPDLFDRAAIQAFADSELARRVVGLTTVTYETAQQGAKPGQTQTITIAERNLSGTFTISEVNLKSADGVSIRRVITAVQGTSVTRDFRQTYRDWNRAGSSSVTTAPGSLVASPVPPHPAGALIGLQKITATGAYTYTPTSGTGSVIVEILGAGGGGAGVASAGGGQVNFGGSGGGGAWGLVRLTSGFSGATGVVGAKGTGGASGNNDGNDGGDTTFITTGAVTYTAGGGDKGVCRTSFAPPITAASGNGGVLSGSFDLSSRGTAGDTGIAPNTSVGYVGAGGPSRYGARTDGPPVIVSSSTAGTSAQDKGVGGSGAVSSNAGGAKAGGDGSDGMVIIWEYR